MRTLTAVIAIALAYTVYGIEKDTCQCKGPFLGISLAAELTPEECAQAHTQLKTALGECATNAQKLPSWTPGRKTAVALALTACKTTLEHASENLCGPTSKNLVAKMWTQVTRVLLTHCLEAAAEPKDRKDCEKAFKAANKFVDDATMKLAELRGAAESVVDKMKACGANKVKCKEDLKKHLEKLVGKTLDKAELEAMLVKAGQTEAAKKISDCILLAKDPASGKKCFLTEKGQEAKAAFAAAAGKLVSEIKDSDLYKAVQEFANQEVFDILGTCLEDANKDVAKVKACFQSEDLKKAISGVMGGDPNLLKDSKVREFFERQLRSEEFALLRNCATGKKAECKKNMKDLRAKMTGMLPEQITDFDLQREINSAIEEYVPQEMKACMQEAAGDAAKQGKCKELVTKMIEKIGHAGTKTHAKLAKVHRVLKQGAVDAMDRAFGACPDTQTRAECLDEAMKEAAEAWGKKVISKAQAEYLNMKAAVKAVVEAVEACAAVKKENPTATCEDVVDKYLEARHETKPASPVKVKILKQLVIRAAQAQIMKEYLKSCVEVADTEESVGVSLRKQCIKDAKANARAIMEAVVGKVSDAVENAKEKIANHMGELRELGEYFESCLETGTAETACKEDLAEFMEKVDETIQSVDDAKKKAWAVIKEYYAQNIKEHVDACIGDDKSECLKEARDQFVKFNKARKFLQQKALAGIKVAYETCAACTEAGVEQATCDIEAKAAYMAVPGANEAKWDKASPKVKKLCTGVKDGLDLIMKKISQISLEVHTDGPCDNAVKLKIMNKVLTLSTVSEADVKDEGCSVAGFAVYLMKVNTANMTDDKVEEAADSIESEVSAVTRRLSTRRLVTLSEVGVAADAELCTATDATCGSSDFGPSGPGGGASATGTNGVGVADDATGLSTMPLLVFGAIFSQLFW